MIVRPNRLREYLKRKLALGSKESGELADLLLAYFGYNTVIIDNAIQSEHRRIFYRLQEEGILHSYFEDAVLPSGKSWRIAYWELDLNDIDRTPAEKVATLPSTYEALPADVWQRGAPSA